jgi:hypothetical protein
MASRAIRPTDIIEPNLIEFLREQDGEPERELKQRLIPILEEAMEIKSAYLVVADYHDGSPPSVVLGLRSEKGDDPVMVERIGKFFREVFDAKEHLDVLFMNSEKERAVRAVCSPFYVR